MKSRVLLWFAAVAAVLPAGAIRAAADRAPSDILAAMRTGGISRQYCIYNADSGNGPIEFHVYEGPVGHDKAPQDHSDFNTQNGSDHLYWVDAFSRSGGALHLVNTTFFTLPDRFTPSSEANFKWLKPKLHKSPVLFSTFGESDGRADVLVAYPDGIAGESYIQVLESGGEGDGGNGYSFDTTDANGLMVVTDTLDMERPRTHEVTRKYWTGNRFAPGGGQAEQYFVIAASDKTREQAEQFVRQNNLWNTAAIWQSSHFGLLQPGFYIVAVGSGVSEANAAAIVTKFKKRGLACYVKKAM